LPPVRASQRQILIDESRPTARRVALRDATGFVVYGA
jgi:hypothetical protein